MVTELLSLIGPAGQMVRVLLSSDWLSELFTGASFPLTLHPQPAPLIHFSATSLVWCSNFSDNSLISFRASRFFHRNAFWVISIIVSNQLLISGRVTERWSESPCHKRVSVHSADGQKPHWALRDALLLSHLPTSLVSWTLGNLRIFLPFVNVRCHLLNLNHFSD